MSLQLAARHLAQQGRGNDSALVHMTPKELASLQTLAQRNGGSLSINPQTGLPEAGFLESLLPAVIGGGLSVASGGAIDPMTAAMLVGGGQAMMTGDLNKGLMAGIGAYGGAGMGQYMANAGSVVPAAAKDTVIQQTAAELAPVSVASGVPDAAQVAAAQSLPAPMNYPGGSLPPTVTVMPKDFDAFQRGFSGENALGFMKANPMQAAALASGPLMEATTATPSTPAVDSDKGANANAGIKYNPNYINPLPAPNRYGIEQVYNRPTYMAEGGQVEHYVAGGLTPALRTYQELQQQRAQQRAQIDTKNQFDEYMKSVRGGTVRPTLPPVPTPTPTPIAPTQPIETSTPGGGGGGDRNERDESRYSPTSEGAYNVSRLGQMVSTVSPFLGGPISAYGDYLAKNVNPNYSNEGRSRPAPTFGMSLSDNDDSVGRDDFASGFGISLSDNNDSVGRDDFSPSPSELAGTSALNSAYGVTDAKRDAAPTVDYSTGLYNDLSAKPDSSFPAGTNYTDKAFTRDTFGRVLSPDAPYTSGATTSSNTALTQQNAIAGSAFQRALNSVASTTPEAAPAISPVDPYAFGYSLSDNDDSVGRTPFDFGYSLSDNDDSVGRDDFASGFGISPSDNDDSVGRNDFASGFGISPSDNFSPDAEATARAENTAAMTAAQIDRINALRETSIAEDRKAAEAAAAEVSRQETERADAQTRQEAADRAYKAQSERNAEVARQEAERQEAERAAAVRESLDRAEKQAAERNAELADARTRNEAAQAATRAQAERNAEVSRQEAERAARDSAGAFPGGSGAPPSGGSGDNDGGYSGGDFGYSGSDNNDSVGRSDNDGGGGGGESSGGGEGGGHSNDSDRGDARGGYYRHGQFDYHPFAQGGYAYGGLPNPYNLGSYSDGGRLLKGPGDGVSDSIPATIGKGRPARLADGEFVIPARIVSEIGNGSTDAGARKLYAMMDRIQASRKKTVGKGKVAKNTRAEKYLPR